MCGSECTHLLKFSFGGLVINSKYIFISGFKIRGIPCHFSQGGRGHNTLDCKLYWYQKFCKHAFLFVDLGTFLKTSCM